MTDRHINRYSLTELHQIFTVNAHNMIAQKRLDIMHICYCGKDIFSYLLCNCCCRQQRDKEDFMQEHTLRTKLNETVFCIITLCYQLWGGGGYSYCTVIQLY